MQGVLVWISLISFCFSSEVGDGRTFNTPQTQLGPNLFSVNGTIVVPDPANLCHPATTPGDLFGKIVLVDPNFCIASEKAFNAQEAGAIGIILIEYRTTKGLLYFNLGGIHDNDISVPTVEISLDDSKNLEGVNITITPGENLFITMGEGVWGFYSVIFFIWDFGIICWAVFQLYLFSRSSETGGTPRMALFVLSTIIFAGVIRIPLLIDPNGSRRILSWNLVELFLTIDFSFNIISIYTIAFYTDAATRVKGVRLELKKFKWFGYGICLILAVIEIVSSILRALLMPAKPFMYGKMLLYIVSSLAVAWYFIVTRRRLIKHISIKDSRRPRLYAGFFLAACLILFVFTALMIPTKFYTRPVVYYWVRFFSNVWFYIAASLQIYMFVPKTKESNTSTQSEQTQVTKKLSAESDEGSSDDKSSNEESDEESSNDKSESSNEESNGILLEEFTTVSESI